MICVTVITAVTVLLLFLDAQLRPLIAAAVRAQAENVFTEAVDCAVQEALSASNLQNTAAVHTDMSENGTPSFLAADTAEINCFRADISDSMRRQLEEYEEKPLRVPLGTLTGISWLTGRGPEVGLRLRLNGGVTTRLDSRFESAGVNQTMHSIDCTVEAKMYSMIPGCGSIELSTNIMVAQSVIVGDTPDSFTYVYGDQSDTVGRIFDYGDPYGNDISG